MANQGSGGGGEGRFALSEIYAYLRDGSYPVGLDKSGKTVLRRRSKYFQINGDDLYYIGGVNAAKSGTSRLVIEDFEKRKRIVAASHDLSHFGLHRTNDIVSSKYYWPGLFTDVKKYVDSCDRCQRQNKLNKSVGTLHPIPVTSKLFYQVGMDLIGPLPETARGNKYIVTLTDYFSKWAEAAPLPSKHAAGICKFIYSFMCRFGCPQVLITDQGREFINELSNELYSITRTRHKITSAYHPQTNGLTERFNQTLCRCLPKLCNQEQNNWDDNIDSVLMGYRASFQSSIQHSPYFMLFQQHMRLPIDNDVKISEEECKDEVQLDIFMTSLMESRKKVFSDAELSIIKAQEKQKNLYDKKHEVATIEIGSDVLLQNTAQKQRKGGKLESAWLGPYVISRSLGKGLYELSKNGKVIKNKANIGRLKLYRKRTFEEIDFSTKSEDRTTGKSSEDNKSRISEDGETMIPIPAHCEDDKWKSEEKEEEETVIEVGPESREEGINIEKLEKEELKIAMEEKAMKVRCSVEEGMEIARSQEEIVIETGCNKSKEEKNIERLEEEVKITMVEVKPVKLISSEEQGTMMRNSKVKEMWYENYDVISGNQEPQKKKVKHLDAEINDSNGKDAGKYWIETLLLFKTDKENLQNGGWLSDAHVYAASKLLKNQYPTQNGLLSPLPLYHNLVWKSSNTDFIQIINVCGNHWVCASNIGCPPNSCCVYDSLYPNYSTSLTNQLAAIMKTPEDSFVVKYMNVQQQAGANDCGLFAIAFAAALCNNKDPSQYTFNQTRMRKHLSLCFEKGMISDFPSCHRERRHTTAIVSSKKIAVYCTCRLPWGKDITQFGGLAQCRHCRNWFHQKCANIPREVFEISSCLWKCLSCKHV